MYGQNFPVVQERRIAEIERKLEEAIRRLDEMESSEVVSPFNIATNMKEQSSEVVANASITEEVVIKPKSTKKKTTKKKKR